MNSKTNHRTLLRRGVLNGRWGHLCITGLMVLGLTACGSNDKQTTFTPQTVQASPTPSPTPTIAVVDGIARPAPECVTLDGPQVDTTWRIYGWLGSELKVWNYTATLLTAQALANKMQTPDLAVRFVWYCPPAV